MWVQRCDCAASIEDDDRRFSVGWRGGSSALTCARNEGSLFDSGRFDELGADSADGV